MKHRRNSELEELEEQLRRAEAEEAAAVAAVPVISTYDDHRMAMAFAPCAALVPGLGIAEPAVVSKSYPEYWDHLRHVGAVIDSKEADRA